MNKKIIIPVIMLVALAIIGSVVFVTSSKDISKSERQINNSLAPTPPPRVLISNINDSRVKAKIASLKANLSNIRVEAVLIYDKNLSYENLCVNRTINKDASSTLSGNIDAVLVAQGVSDIKEAGITCIAEKEKYVISVDYNDSLIIGEEDSVCFDSSGNMGDNRKYVLDEESVSCVSAL